MSECLKQALRRCLVAKKVHKPMPTSSLILASAILQQVIHRLLLLLLLLLFKSKTHMGIS